MGTPDHTNGQAVLPFPNTLAFVANVWLELNRLLVNYMLSAPYVDVALVGVREPRFVELNHEVSDDVASRIDLAALHDRYVR